MSDRYANVNLAVTDYQEDKVTISVAAADAPAAISDIDADCFSEVDRDCNENADIRTDSAVDPSVVVIDGLQSGTIYEMTIESSLFGNIPPKKLHYQTITACTSKITIKLSYPFSEHDAHFQAQLQKVFEIFFDDQIHFPSFPKTLDRLYCTAIKFLDTRAKTLLGTFWKASSFFKSILAPESFDPFCEGRGLFSAC